MNLTPMITTAGLNAVINATNDGVNAKIVSIVLGDTAWEPDATAETLQNERARVSITGSTRINPTQIHLTAIENGDVEYWVREIGFILEDGTLLAVWSQPDQDRPLAYKAAAIDLLLGFDLVLSALPADSVMVEDSGGLNLGPATLTVAGIVRMANDDEAMAATRQDIAMSPATTRALIANRLINATTDTPGLVQLATAEEVEAGVRDDVAITPATLVQSPTTPVEATTDTAGVVRLATTDEVNEGTNNRIAITPAVLSTVLTDLLIPATASIVGLSRFATFNETFDQTRDNLMMSPASVRLLGDNLYKQRLVFGPVQLTEWLNENDGLLDYTVPDNAVMVGLVSEHSNATEDRRFRIRYRQLSLDNG